MKHFRKTLLLGCVGALLPATLWAEEAEMKAAASPVAKRIVGGHHPGQNCPMQERANLNINFNFRADSLREARQKFDSHVNEIDALIKQSKSQQWDLQSMNYSVSEQGGGDTEPKFMISGNASYQTDSADEAFAVMEQLSAKKMHVSVNVNKYRNCSQNYID